MSRNSKKNNNNSTGSKESILLASAAIKSGVHTDILQEDIQTEYQSTQHNTDDARLVNHKWVRFFNNDSAFLKQLRALITNSPTQGTILQQKTAITMGDGFIPVRSEQGKVPFLQTLRKMLQKITASDNSIEELNDLISNVNLNNESLDEVIRKVVFDRWAFGNCFVELVKGTREGVDVVYMYHIPVDHVAIHKANENNIIESIGISNDWETQAGSDNSVKTLPLYPNFNDDGRCAIHVKNYCAGFYYWGMPENVTSRLWQEIEYRIPKYNIAKFKNGFTPSGVLQFFGNMTEDQAKTLVNNVKNTFTDTGQNNKLLIQVLRDEKAKMNAQVLEDKSDGNYMDLQKLASQAIITSNGWTTSLAGIATNGKLGSNQQIRDELEYVTNTTIKGVRRTILQKIVNVFVKENAKVNSGLDGIMLDIANLNPVSLASSLEANKLLTVDEQRHILGYDSLGQPIAEPEKEE